MQKQRQIERIQDLTKTIDSSKEEKGEEEDGIVNIECNNMLNTSD